ncbi:short-chain dehydrogenase [Burkholderia alba]|uniref:short-chain dehydrogenase n=1 Tax=Burkholderia alba TaxID=2683677 RepID=UPI0038991F0F
MHTGAVHAGAAHASAVHAGAAPAGAGRLEHAAAPGIAPDGRAFAVGFAQLGWDVALAVGDPAARDAAAALVAEIEALGRRAVVLVADLSLEDDVRRLVPACTAALGRPACIVSQSEPARAGDARAAGYAPLLDAMARNVAAPLALARALHDATPDQANRDETLRAAMIHVLDQALFHPAPEPLPHALTQAALHRAIGAQALALAPKVRVAGLVRGRATQPDVLADAACYLADAAGITGATLNVDGGEHLAPPAGGRI